MRDKQFYVSNDVYRAFWTLARATAVQTGSPLPDLIVDGILRKYIEDNYPQLFRHQKAVEILEGKLIEGLSPKKLPQGKSE